MTKSSIEITDNAYLITLDKSEFEYPLVRKLLNRLLSGNLHQETGLPNDEDLTGKYPAELGERFDFLADK
ncbi:hypothetical protein JHJ32_18160 [Parapedobacter sp. ISTM3]|uniref:Uncharacterized protein n=1 Tax=Parapedobacter luteus TaxID=623280 RepID=A0A1T5APJ9_9SPHI|nr:MULTISPECIES: hypothetical protein [Parapedobacter]MBK1441927.1 hypothetical protein [Parapedobacter sp. ISTM3]SKB36730.1 hypothetical protein SAMN05660226_00941 [Parapedobacter luteus]